MRNPAFKIMAFIVTGWLSACSIQLSEPIEPDYPFVYNGTEYAGIVSVKDPSSPCVYGNYSDSNVMTANIRVSAPAARGFTADGYFVLKGQVLFTGANQYAYVRVVKENGGGTDVYWLRQDFSRRIWLRWGSGRYDITVHKSLITSGNLNYEGEILGWTYYTAVYAFAVENTRDEDGRYYYPSAVIQSDAPLIRELAARLTGGLLTEYDRALKIHDFVVTNLYYDDTYQLEGSKRKQDALTVLENGTGVCAGYTDLYCALMRASGIRAKYVSGIANGGSHGWAAVYTQGAWKLVDPTWDDPAPNDHLPSNLFHSWFLLDSFSNHTWESDNPHR